MEAFCSRISADVQDRKAFRPYAFGKLPLRVERDQLIVRIRHDDHPSAWLVLHGRGVINRVVQSLIPGSTFPPLSRVRVFSEIGPAAMTAQPTSARICASPATVCAPPDCPAR